MGDVVEHMLQKRLYNFTGYSVVDLYKQTLLKQISTELKDEMHKIIQNEVEDNKKPEALKEWESTCEAIVERITTKLDVKEVSDKYDILKLPPGYMETHLVNVDLKQINAEKSYKELKAENVALEKDLIAKKKYRNILEEGLKDQIKVQENMKKSLAELNAKAENVLELYEDVLSETNSVNHRLRGLHKLFLDKNVTIPTAWDIASSQLEDLLVGADTNIS